MLGILSTKYFARKATASLTSRFMSYAKVSSRAAEKEHEVKWTKRKRMILPSLIDIPSPTVEEAVDNILYNNPVTSPTKIKKHTLNCLVSNEPGVLSRISGILASRGFNIESLVVSKTELSDLSRMTIVINGQDSIIEQARKQLEDIVPVWAVIDLTHGNIVERELLLIKVSAIPLGSLSEEAGSDSKMINTPSNSPVLNLAIQRQSLIELAKVFGGVVADVGFESITLQLCAKTSKIDKFINLLKPFGIIEVARSGAMAISRSQVEVELDQDQDEISTVDATQLPPG